MCMSAVIKVMTLNEFAAGIEKLILESQGAALQGQSTKPGSGRE